MLMLMYKHAHAMLTFMPVFMLMFIVHGTQFETTRFRMAQTFVALSTPAWWATPCSVDVLVLQRYIV